MSTRFRLVLEYDGADFVGWQLQARGRSVQGVLEDALARLLGHPVRVEASGRTDAGVHAEGQVAAFDTTAERSEREVLRGLNGLLPEDVACLRAERVPQAFDPRRWAFSKRYRYTWLDREARSPLRRRRAWMTGRPLDEGRMAEAAGALVGRHDFSAFRATGCAAAHPVRVVEAASVTRRDDEVHLEVQGQGFLRHMVRIMAGSLVEVGLGRRPPSWLAEVRDGRERAHAGRTAPAHGLTLVEVHYEDGPPPWWRPEAR